MSASRTGLWLALCWLLMAGAHGQTMVINSFRHATEAGGGGLLTDLVAHWKMNEASGIRADSHGANDLTDNNTVGSGAGKIDGAADFEDGNSEYLSIADNPTIRLGADSAFTVAAWVFMETSLNNAILTKEDGAGGYEFRLWHRNTTSTFRFDVSNGTTATEVSLSGGASDGTWYLILAWHDPANDKICIQVNGGTVDEVSWTGGTLGGSGNLIIGAQNGVWFWDGLIDSVSIWKRVLTSTERTDLYNGGAGLDYESF